MPKIEMTLADMRQDCDWAQVFADKSYGNTDKTVSVAPPNSSVSPEPMTRDDVEEIVALVNGDNDGPDWLGVFRLRDGRFLVASGCCDYTGWDCQAGNSLIVCASLADVIQFGLTDAEKLRLELTEPAG